MSFLTNKEIQKSTKNGTSEGFDCHLTKMESWVGTNE